MWREPVDEETALFLGYARVLRGDAAAALLRRRRRCRRRPPSPSAAPPWSSPTTGPARRVVSARATPELVRLVVRVEGSASWTPSRRSAPASAPGDEVSLRVDVTRLAVLPITR